MFLFESLGSGSSGNAYIIRTDGGMIMIDAGVPIRRLKKLMRAYGFSTGKMNGILLTHNHIDHVRSLGILSQKDRLTAYMTKGTLEGIRLNPAISKKPQPALVKLIEKGQAFTLADMEITPFEVPHDSRDNVGYLICHGRTRFCLVTDCGHWTDEIESYVSGANHLVLESNYDEQMLQSGPYPVFLQNRIRGGKGHLSNREAADVLQRHSGHLKRVWLCHLSEKNNTPALALESARAAVGVGLAPAHRALPIVEALEREQPSRPVDLEEDAHTPEEGTQLELFP